MMEGRLEIYYVKELDGRCEVRISKEHKPRLVVERNCDSKQLVHAVVAGVMEVMRLDVD